MQLIKIQELTIGNGKVNAVNARDLYEFLMIRNDFSTWIKEQVARGRFIEKRDFEVFLENQGNPFGGRPRTDYALTIDCAKHIAMMSGTDKGYEVREYFIECEKKLIKPLSRLEMIDQMREIELARIAAEEKAQTFANTIVKQQPKIEYYNRVAISEEAALNIRDAANRLGFRQNDFVHMMLEKKWLYRATDGRLKAYADKLKSGFLKDKDVVDHNGDSRAQVIFTDKGIAQIIKQKMKPKQAYYEEIIPLFGNTAEDIADAAFAERYLQETRGY
jgi:phage anti-repressor protein/phage antirepressor YoqD-like protein